MRVCRVAGILLVMGAIGGALAGFRGAGEGASELAAGDVGAIEATPIEHGEARKAVEIGSLALAVTKGLAVMELSGDENAAVAEMSELQLMGGEAGLVLASEQWAALAEVTLRTQAVRQAYEAEIASTTQVAPGRWRLDVPGYAEAGARLRAKFFSEMGGALGASVAAEVIEKIGPALEGHFAGFGVSLQTLDVVGDSRAAASGDYVVTRTVAYSRDAGSGEQVAVRRETYFAGWGDPVVEKLRG